MEAGQQYNIMDSYESSENALMDSFKAAALKVTTLYKDSLVQNRKAYASGYQQALQDLYEFISTQPENGFIPVQEVLTFARQKNNQLAFEMNGHADSTTTTTNNNNGATTTTTSNTTTTANGNNANHNQIGINHHGSRLVSQTEENAKLAIQNNPFQIDPHAQFTFTHEVPALQNVRSMDGLWDQATMTMTNEGFKRRMLPTELSFMGRSLNMENAAIHHGWHEPPFKRGRLRREEQQQQQQQHQHQHQQQQQQQQQQDQQQLQFLQQQQLHQQQPPHL